MIEQRTAKEPLATTNGEVRKKKRPRLRNRPRNKANRVTAAETVQQTQSNQLITKTTVQPLQAKESSPTSAERIPLENCTQKLKPMKPAPTPPQATAAPKAAAADTGAAKTREQIVAEREAKKLAKQAKKTKGGAVEATTLSVAAPAAAPDTTKPTTTLANTTKPPGGTSEPQQVAPVTPAHVGDASAAATAEKLREQVKAEREAKKQAKQTSKAAKSGGVPAATPGTQQLVNATIDASSKEVHQTAVEDPALSEEKKKPTLTKAERRALQEAQRAAKTQKITAPVSVATVKPTIKTAAKLTPMTNVTTTPTATKSSASSAKVAAKNTTTSNDCKVKLFNHLKCARQDVSLFVNNAQLHPSIARLGEQYAKRTVVGSNARCIGFLNALKMVIQDFETPPKKEFSRSLETSIKICVEHLQKCRPLAVSVNNAYKHIKHVLTQLPTDRPESELKENLCHFIDTYVENQIGKAAQAISSSMQEKISNGDVILTFGCSSLINFICEEAHRRHVDFRVIIVDSRPFCEGQELLRRLHAKEIPCTYVLINAVGFVMPEATKVLLGAHALLSNGYVMARTGTAQVALVARAYNVPVLVCCETHKFSETFQTDAIVYNELGNPDDLILSEKCCLTNWQAKGKMSPLNLIYDITPPELVTAVVTEVSILPCTSVPVILRIKPTEIGYYS